MGAMASARNFKLGSFWSRPKDLPAWWLVIRSVSMPLEKGIQSIPRRYRLCSSMTDGDWWVLRGVYERLHMLKR